MAAALVLFNAALGDLPLLAARAPFTPGLLGVAFGVFWAIEHRRAGPAA